MTIRAIETFYKGYRFRSRLEARWAVFFDALTLERRNTGISLKMPTEEHALRIIVRLLTSEFDFSYEYEREGFNLDGIWYLPDFYFYKLPAWAEIKPEPFTQEQIKLCMKLANQTGQYCFLFDGVPDTKSYLVVWPDCKEPVICNWFKSRYAWKQARSARFEHGEKP